MKAISFNICSFFSLTDGSDLKRKLSSAGSDAQTAQPKKQRTEVEDLTSPLQSGVVSSSSSSSSCSSSSSSSSSSEGQEDDASSTPDEEEYIPRRRGPQMWNSRQRWKDERKRVLKLSLSKLAEIEDPELCMHRSVVINNTVKRLHMDIKNERQAKLRQRQQRMDLFNERFHSTERIGSTDSSQSSKVSPSVDSYDDSSCDEMFGISEDFLRVTIPDRRVPTPIPTNPINQSVSEDSRDSQMDTSEPPVTSRDSQTTCYSSTNNSLMSCDTAMDSASSSSLNARRTGATNAAATTTTNSNSSNGSSSSPRRLVSSVPTNSGSQCATQYRTSRDASSNSSFDPRVPILDTVVYHSLLASLES